MQNIKNLVQWSRGPFISAAVAFLLVGCQSDNCRSGVKITVTKTTPAVTASAPAVAAPVAPSVPAAHVAIRIDAGSTAPYTDSSGNVWLADQGFADGDTVDRGNDVKIANTKDPAIYRTERYGMSEFSCKLPNGKYVVKLHFAETYENITGSGQRVFSYTVAGQEFKDFDVWAKAGGARRAYIETVNVNITAGKLDIIFTSNTDSPEINGIEIIPGS
jgi:endoglucanase